MHTHTRKAFYYKDKQSIAQDRKLKGLPTRKCKAMDDKINLSTFTLKKIICH